MNDDDPKRCPTNLLNDLPADCDAFASADDVGPHQRVADAIADLIESSEEGGKAIGLEGGWGSGKSTVVRLLSDRFDQNDDYTVVLFDAWAHEGDPLRRTFLESIVATLTDYGWADELAWNETIEELAKRRKKTRTLITPHATILGTLVAISVLLVPCGVALVNAGSREGVTLTLGGPVNVLFTLGLVFVLGPLWILVANAVRVGFTDRRLPCLSDYEFLSNDAVSDTHTETIETPEPTSLEFDRYFRSLMNEALSKPSRRLLLVLDNLDRVDADTALSIWGTLQTFLHHRDHDTEKWYRQLWVVVPYDPIRIRKLWNHPEDQELADDQEQGRPIQGTPNKGPSEVTRTTESFLDKSFQVRFQVAPPVLSDWKSFLHDLVSQALPAHEEEQHIIYRVFDHCRARNGAPPTPRELKLFVNQIGAIHRQWQDDFPLCHVAFFVLARKQHTDIVDALRNNTLLTPNDHRLLPDDLVTSLAGLAFNVHPRKGMELLLADAIDDALKKPEPSDLKAISDGNGAGFWAVLDTVATTRWHEEDAAGIATIASRLRESELLVRYDGPEKHTVLTSLRDAAVNLKTWIPVSDGLGKGVGDLLILQRDESVSTTVVRKFCSQLAKVDVTNNDTSDSAALLHEVFELFDVVTSLGHVEAIPKAVALPFKGEDWIPACRAIAEKDVEKKYWERIRPSGKAAEVLTAFMSKVVSGEFSESDVTALEVTQKSAAKYEWSEFCSAIQGRMDAGQNIPSDECLQLMSSLFQLESLGIGEAEEVQKTLSTSGHLLHHFHQAKTQNHITSQAALILSFARQRPKIPKPPTAGNSDDGHQMLLQALDASDEDLSSDLYILAKQYNLLPGILGVIQSSGKYYPLFVDVLKRVADSDTPHEVFTPAIVLENWSTLRDHLNDESGKARFQTLVGRIPGLCDEIQSADVGFTRLDASLYLNILRGAKGRVSKFVSWCLAGLRRLSEEEWKVDIAGSCACLAICIELTRQGKRPSLASSFVDALQDHAGAVANGTDLPAEWIREAWSTVLDCIEEESTRKVLRERLIETAVEADGNLSEEYFQMYGDEISDVSVLAVNDRVLTHFFTALVREKHASGLAWLKEFSFENQGFLSKVRAEHTVKDLTDRLQSLIDEPSDEETHATIVSIAANFGIQPTPIADESDDTHSEVEQEASADGEEDETT